MKRNTYQFVSPTLPSQLKLAESLNKSGTASELSDLQGSYDRVLKSNVPDDIRSQLLDEILSDLMLFKKKMRDLMSGVPPVLAGTAPAPPGGVNQGGPPRPPRPRPPSPPLFRGRYPVDLDSTITPGSSEPPPDEEDSTPAWERSIPLYEPDDYEYNSTYPPREDEEEEEEEDGGLYNSPFAAVYGPQGAHAAASPHPPSTEEPEGEPEGEPKEESEGGPGGGPDPHHDRQVQRATQIIQTRFMPVLDDFLGSDDYRKETMLELLGIFVNKPELFVINEDGSGVTIRGVGDFDLLNVLNNLGRMKMQPDDESIRFAHEAMRRGGLDRRVLHRLNRYVAKYVNNKYGYDLKEKTPPPPGAGGQQGQGIISDKRRGKTLSWYTH